MFVHGLSFVRIPERQLATIVAAPARAGRASVRTLWYAAAMRRVVALFSILPGFFAAACAVEPIDSSEDELKNIEKTGGSSQRWIYQGPLPSLEKASVVASLKGHTLRVTGLLPKGFAGALPFYARTRAALGGRSELTVVYPIATGAVDPSTGKAPMAPGNYGTLWTVPFTPTNDKAAWGGFPFMLYQPQRGLAFHGPITSTRNADTGDWEWRLVRGPVSHGCNRMQGEHVVELAHLLGTDMSKPHTVGESYPRAISVTITTKYDEVDGALVDVDYPARPEVVRPKGNVALFPTWDSRHLPNLVCAYDAKRPLDGHHCDAAGLVAQDLTTGEMLFEPESEPFIGHACASDADCGFVAGGKTASCLLSGGHGYCTIPCEGYCPDRAGEAPTFCGTLGGVGRCMAKAGVENAGCADVTGTTAKKKERFVGNSGAAAKVATVCSF